MFARIYSPAKTAMQSGKAGTGHWVLDFINQEPKPIEPLMGYTSALDMQAQVKLRFDSAEQAVAYAQKHNIPYHVETPHLTERPQISYADNFRSDRLQPWTH